MNKKMKKIAALILAFCMTLTLAACAQSTSADNVPAQTAAATPQAAPEAIPEATPEATPEVSDEEVDGELILDHEEEIQYAQEFTLTHYKGGYKSFTIPKGQEGNWVYLIVPEGKSVPADLEENVVVLQQPIDKIRCDSGTAAMFAAFGGLDHVSTLNTEVGKIAIDAVIKKMESGEIKYSGAYKEPDYEMVTAEGTELVIDTAMLDGYPETKDQYTALGIPFFVTRNSKEVHPLGHSEWAKVYGAVVGMWDEAVAYFEEQVAKVDAVSAAERVEKKVAAVYFSGDGDKVYARRGGDYIAKMVDLAGADYIMADYEPDQTGVATITNEAFYSMCIDADIVIYLNMAAKLYTMDELLEFFPLMKDFKAVKEGNVYVARNSFTQYTYDNASVIEDMNTIFNDPTADTFFFTKMK